MQFPKNRDIVGFELDGYCEKLNIAFEYHGKQHYEHNEFFHKTVSGFQSQQERDDKMRQKCKDNSIPLIEIPYTKSVDNETLAQFIYDELIAHNIPIVKRVDEIKFENFKVAQSKILELNKFAEKKGGKLLTTVYIDNKTKMLWECKERHQWEAMSSTITDQKSWCPVCAGSIVTLSDVRHLAILKGGRCLSNEYINSTTNLLWECKKGHQWHASQNSIKQNHWCPTCADNRLTIEEMRQIAESKGGRCINAVYIPQTKMLWECENGHQWEAKGSRIKAGHWCPKCSKRLPIKDMQSFALSKGGLFLSKKYLGTKELHLWQCRYGHQFENTYCKISINKYFCPICKKNKQINKTKQTMGTKNEKLNEIKLAEFKAIAESIGGKCLSTEYINAQTKLTWESACGHKWDATPDSIKNGSWSPQ